MIERGVLHTGKADCPLDSKCTGWRESMRGVTREKPVLMLVEKLRRLLRASLCKRSCYMGLVLSQTRLSLEIYFFVESENIKPSLEM